MEKVLNILISIIAGVFLGGIIAYNYLPLTEEIVYKEPIRGFTPIPMPAPTPEIKVVEVIKEVKTSSNPELLSEIERLNKELIRRNSGTITPSPIPNSPQTTPIQSPMPGLMPTPLPKLGILLVDFPNSTHKCKDYEKRIGLTQHFEMEYRGEINAEDYTWYSPWAKPTYWNGARGQITFNNYGEHLVRLTDKWGQKTQCWLNITEN